MMDGRRRRWILADGRFSHLGGCRGETADGGTRRQRHLGDATRRRVAQLSHIH